MFHYLKCKELLAGVNGVGRCLCDFSRDYLKEKYSIVAQFISVGSHSKNMVTQNGNGKIDADYNGILISYPSDFVEKDLKCAFMDSFNRVLKELYGITKGCRDSTSAITIPTLHFYDDPSIKFSFDIGIILTVRSGNKGRLIHDKIRGTYYFSEIPNSKDVDLREKEIKDSGLWNEVRDLYLDKKNMYLRRGDNNHPSYICRIESINEVYQKYFK